MHNPTLHPADSSLLSQVISEDLRLARFEAQGAKFAIQDNDPTRAYNHALWAARLARRAVRRFEAFSA